LIELVEGARDGACYKLTMSVMSKVVRK
jgi:hypothetical protein